MSDPSSPRAVVLLHIFESSLTDPFTSGRRSAGEKANMRDIVPTTESISRKDVIAAILLLEVERICSEKKRESSTAIGRNRG